MIETPTMAAWLLTYLLHSTLLFIAVRLLTGLLPLSDLLKDTLWKVALVGGLLTATVQMTAGGGSMRFELPHPEEIAGTALEAPLIVATVPAQGAPTGARAAPADRVAAVDTLFLPRASARVAGSRSPAPALRPGPAASPVATPAAAAAGVPPAPRELRGPGPDLQSSSAPLAGRSTSPARGWSTATWTWGLMAWAAGAFLLLGRLVATRRRFLFRIGRRERVPAGFLVETLERLRDAARIRRRVRLTWSPRLFSPVALGGSEVCLPGRARLELSRAQQETMLAHEVAHVARRDSQWLALSAVIESVLFVQPLNRLIRRHMRETTEYVCDQWAARQTGHGLTLARCLAQVAAWLEPAAAKRAPAACMARPGSALVRRIERLTSGGTNVQRDLPTGRRALLAGTCLGLTIALAPAFGIEPGGPEGATTDDAAAETQMRAALAAVPGVSGGSRRDRDQRGSSSNWVWNDDGRRLAVRTRGEVELNDDESDVVAISPDGYLRIEEETQDGDREIRVAPDGDGGFVYRYAVDGERREFDRGARRWMASVLQDVREQQRTSRREMEHQREQMRAERARMAEKRAQQRRMLAEEHELRTQKREEMQLRMAEKQQQMAQQRAVREETMQRQRVLRDETMQRQRLLRDKTMQQQRRLRDENRSAVGEARDRLQQMSEELRAMQLELQKNHRRRVEELQQDLREMQEIQQRQQQEMLDRYRQEMDALRDRWREEHGDEAFPGGEPGGPLVTLPALAPFVPLPDTPVAISPAIAPFVEPSPALAFPGISIAPGMPVPPDVDADGFLDLVIGDVSPVLVAPLALPTPPAPRPQLAPVPPVAPSPPAPPRRLFKEKQREADDEKRRR